MNSPTMKFPGDWKIAILADHGVNQAEVSTTRDVLQRKGVTVHIVSSQPVEVKAWNYNDWGVRFRVDRSPVQITWSDYDAIIIPGGPFHADSLRADSRVLALLKEFYASGKIIGAIGHGIQLLISGEAVDGKRISAYPSLQDDARLARAVVCNEGVVVDNGLVTCRGEECVLLFAEVLLEQLGQGIHQRTEVII